MNEPPPRRWQPRTQRCRTLTLLWFLPSLGALVILLRGVTNWPRLEVPLDALRALTFEQWIALAVLLVHPALWLLGRRFAATEPFREVSNEDVAVEDKNEEPN